MSGRSLGILARLPRHFDAARRRDDGSPASLLGAVVEAIARDLDELSTDLAKVRRAHRIGHADTVQDVLALAGMHGMRGELFAPLWRRVADIAQAIAALRAAGADDDRRTAATAALAAWGLDLAAAVPEGVDPLSLWAPPTSDGAFDTAGAAARLATHLADAISHRARLDLARTRVVRTAAVHADGNGTVAALLRQAAAALDLDLDLERNRAVKQELIARDAPSIHPDLVSDDFLHSRDRYVHVTYVRDRFRLSRPVLQPVPTGHAAPAPDPTPLAQRHDLVVLDQPFDHISIVALARQLGISLADLTARATAAGLTVTPTTVFDALTAARLAAALGRDTISILPTALDLLAVVENPVRRQTRPSEDAPHGHQFTVVRRGFGAALLRIRVTGTGTATVGPMVVDRDAGQGVGFDGAVPAGAVLEFTEEGRVRLDGADVTARAYAWRGGCFADAESLVSGKDFTFAGSPTASGRRVARFAVTEPVGPPGALDRAAQFPTQGEAIATPTIGLNVTRFAYFVRVAHAGTRRPGGAPPDPVTPRAFAALFDESVWAAAPETAGPIAGKVNLSWLEHEAYAVQILLPARLQALDDDVPDDHKLPALVGAAIERVRPAGIAVRVGYLDEAWRLGDGRLPSDEDDPLTRVTGGTVLAPTEP
ncbi:MAG TPA: hypothetical protein VFK02_19260 [Kofleriaceae bacterium]|nr:hypothetical protein [Kofleriaceae bacterium]